MKKTILSLLGCLLLTCACQAQTALGVFDKLVSTFKASGTVSASYALTGQSRGTIVMWGNQFRVLSSDVKSWFDGRTLWTWASATGEVNVTEPTAQELITINPLAAASALRKSYGMKLSTGKQGYVLTLTPKKGQSAQLKSLVLHVSKAYQLTSARLTSSRGKVVNLTLSHYKVHAGYPASTFKFDKRLVPAGTEVVDLR